MMPEIYLKYSTYPYKKGIGSKEIRFWWDKPSFLAYLLVLKYLFLVKPTSQIANYSQKLTPNCHLKMLSGDSHVFKRFCFSTYIIYTISNKKFRDARYLCI